MAIVNFKLKPGAPGYRPLNCQAVAQLIRNVKKHITDNPGDKDEMLGFMHLVYIIGKKDPSIYSDQYGPEWTEEAKEANRRILLEFGKIKPEPTDLENCTA